MQVTRAASQSFAPQLPTATPPQGTSAAQGSPSTTTPSTVGKAPTITAEEGKHTFLRLLIAQLEHQDPLSPMDNADFTAQLAQFSMLEQLESVNTNIRAMVNGQGNLAGLQTRIQAATLVGKEVKVKGNAIEVQDGIASPLSYSLAAAATKVTVEVVDSVGRAVQTIEQGVKPAGEHTLSGIGHDLPTGTYTVRITTQDVAGKPVAVETFVQGHVDGVEYQDDQPYFVIGRNRVAVSDLVSIRESSS